ncbi:hypothetical protein V500_10422 [Pseudogymnoascus sp. VKM F-4518 (FW-2643)]|nr:hypothetical protein V500_10422 [Pseudogymnoascus sp. VKM F-4518 (FW-2643)]
MRKPQKSQESTEAEASLTGLERHHKTAPGIRTHLHSRIAQLKAIAKIKARQTHAIYPRIHTGWTSSSYPLASHDPLLAPPTSHCPMARVGQALVSAPTALANGGGEAEGVGGLVRMGWEHSTLPLYGEPLRAYLDRPTLVQVMTQPRFA